MSQCNSYSRTVMSARARTLQSFLIVPTGVWFKSKIFTQCHLKGGKTSITGISKYVVKSTFYSWLHKRRTLCLKHTGAWIERLREAVFNHFKRFHVH